MKSTKKSVWVVLLAALIVLGGGVYMLSTNDTSLETRDYVGMNSKTYITDKLVVDYPASYEVTPPSASIPIITLQRSNLAKMEIFQMKDFGDRPFGLGETATQFDIDQYIPKDFLTIGSGENQYNVWLYYGNDDETSINELMDIYGSITIK